jgi:hypothetical protein
MTLPTLREAIARHGLDARKSLGQHFLLDPAVCARIAALAGDLAGREVLEIGPGPGGLTRALLDTPAARVVAVELDRRAVALLAELAASHPGRLQVIEGDALKADLAALVPGPRQIVANLPYNIGSPLLVGWLRQASAWERMTLMFQQEVAERHHRRAWHIGRLWAARGPRPVALPLRAAAAPAAGRLHPASQGVVGGGGLHAACGRARPRPVPRHGTLHRRGLRATAQDAARRAEVARRCRGAARRHRHRRHPPGRDAERGGIRHPGPHPRRPRRLTPPGPAAKSAPGSDRERHI